MSLWTICSLVLKCVVSLSSLPSLLTRLYVVQDSVRLWRNQLSRSLCHTNQETSEARHSAGDKDAFPVYDVNKIALFCMIIWAIHAALHSILYVYIA